MSKLSWLPDATMWMRLLACALLIAGTGILGRYLVMRRWSVSVNNREFAAVGGLVMGVMAGTGMARDFVLAAVYSCLFVVGYFFIKVVRRPK
jgi:ABC-type Mn2+/Zn2+ transport system permease subunit